MTPIEKTPPQDKRRRNRAIGITALVLFVIGISWFAYWLIWARFYQYTDDAYVDGNNVMITPQISGIVSSFSVLDGDFVQQGMTLVELDKTDARIALGKAIGELGASVRDVQAMFETAKQWEAAIQVKKAAFIKAGQDYAAFEPIWLRRGAFL